MAKNIKNRNQALRICQLSGHTLSHSTVSCPLSCPHRCSAPSWSLDVLLGYWAIGTLATSCPYDCLALTLITRRPPGRIARNHPKSIDAARESAFFWHDKPSVCVFQQLSNWYAAWTSSWSWARALEIVLQKRNLAKLHIKWKCSVRISWFTEKRR